VPLVQATLRTGRSGPLFWAYSRPGAWPGCGWPSPVRTPARRPHSARCCSAKPGNVPVHFRANVLAVVPKGDAEMVAPRFSPSSPDLTPNTSLSTAHQITRMPDKQIARSRQSLRGQGGPTCPRRLPRFALEEYLVDQPSRAAQHGRQRRTTSYRLPHRAALLPQKTTAGVVKPEPMATDFNHLTDTVSRNSTTQPDVTTCPARAVARSAGQLGD
jgi:hypothetical protein